jgi:hypothetical protein
MANSRSGSEQHASSASCSAGSMKSNQRTPVLKLVLVAAILVFLSMATFQAACNAQEETRPTTTLEATSQIDATEHRHHSHQNDQQHNHNATDEQPTTSGQLSDEHENDNDSNDDGEEQLSGLSTRLPRQYFRLKVSPTSRTSSTFRLVNIRRRAAQQEQNDGRQRRTTNAPATKAGAELAERNGQASAETAASSPNENVSTSQATKKQSRLPKASTKKISSATLKKLLSQTLPKLNGTSPSATEAQFYGGQADGAGRPDSLKGPHFKFVFIQRATSRPAASQNSSNKADSVERANASATTKQQPQQSLAASVSRQLANSLFYSAANLIGHHNLTTAATTTTSGAATQTSQSGLSASAGSLIPSLSALAALARTGRPAQTSNEQHLHHHYYYHHNHHHHQSSADNELARPVQVGANEDANINQIDKSDPANSNSQLDIKRLVSRPTTAAGKQPQTSTSSTKATRKKSRPSTIYNLPVKFVANGQPNSVMFHSIKQHFATIKRLQQQQQQPAAGQQGGAGEPGRARKKQPGAKGASRLKGTNSRLIYLPLKYLSNARPSMLSNVMNSATKASHKSASSLLAAPSSKKSLATSSH